MATKVLNLYAGIGGNRKLWKDVDVTAVEWDEEKAEVYRDHFPDDEVVVTDAHEYLKDHMEDGWGFIWTSPPCPTHSQMESMNHAQYGPRYPDMALYQEIILLSNHANRLGFKYCVENVISYYEPLVEPQQVSRHYFWSNFHIPDHDTPVLRKRGVESRDDRSDCGDGFDYQEHEEGLGYDLAKYDMPQSKKEKCLKNCVHPELGNHIFNAATKNRQATLF